MTEKRFTVPLNYRCIQDNLTKERYMCEDKSEAIDLAYLWTSLNDENTHLKKILGFLKNDNAEDILNVLNSQENRIWELKQENEQLKKRITELELLNDGLNYALQNIRKIDVEIDLND